MVGIKSRIKNGISIGIESATNIGTKSRTEIEIENEIRIRTDSELQLGSRTGGQNSSRVGYVWPLSLFYSDASADGVEERSLVPRSRSHARLRRNAKMSHAFSCMQPAFIDLKDNTRSVPRRARRTVIAVRRYHIDDFYRQKPATRVGQHGGLKIRSTGDMPQWDVPIAALLLSMVRRSPLLRLIASSVHAKVAADHALYAIIE
ncbi:hypothetical protein EVAR_68497_1 [Eumeta japonica]|uniref:Uncharacterized protein n=1 Tax=Eumeta variegata TaxID=151549 RepID=A0A4C1ZW51_EUMVA|nr:hypothetical protein EVAR_68497_1 [Eumeta japonica]